MAYITGQTEQGCCTVGELRDGVLVCAPLIPQKIFDQGKTNLWHQWHAKVVGTVGETVKIRVEWPEYDPEKVAPELRNQPNFEIEWESFLRPAADVVFQSCDRIHWTRVENVKIVGHALEFETVLSAEESYYTVTLYYTPARCRNLLSLCEKSCFVRTDSIGTDAGGDEIYAFTVTDDSVPNDQKQALFFMGAQHCSEYNGAHLSDNIIRFLLSDDADAARIRRAYVCYFIPVASVTSWRLGADVHLSGENPNRDWVKRELPTTRAIHEWLSARVPAPVFLLDIHSGIANYGNWNTCQAISTNPDKSAPTYDNEHRFVDLIYESADFLPTRRYWDDFAISNTNFDGYARTYGQCQTIEVSHYAMYDRTAGRHFPIDEANLARFARQLILAAEQLTKEN